MRALVLLLALCALFSVGAAASGKGKGKEIKEHAEGRAGQLNKAGTAGILTPDHKKFSERIEIERKKFSADKTLTGAIVGAELRCQGFHCPQWALDISRWDTIRYVNQPYYYNLLEALPLAPTFQRDANLVSAYDPVSRIFTVAVQSYPAPGLDTFFSAQISDGVTSAKWVTNNIIVAHPDTAPGNEGSMTMVRIHINPQASGTLLVTFNDGTVASIDLAAETKQYTILDKFNSGAGSVVAAQPTSAQVIDGSVLKSFLYDSTGDGKTYLVQTDLSKTPVSSTAPLLLQPIKGITMAFTRPINAHIITDGVTVDSTGTQTAVVYGGNWDMVLSVNCQTGEQTGIIPNMVEGAGVSVPQYLYCNTDVKDCDYWTTSSYDTVGKTMYLQTHTEEEGVYTAMISAVEYIQQAAGVFPYLWPTANAAVFGWSAHQFVNFVESAKKDL